MFNFNHVTISVDSLEDTLNFYKYALKNIRNIMMIV